RLALIQSSFHSYGTVAPGVYLLVVIAEVILAPIPGTLLYLPGGLVFGWLVGGSVYLAGNFSVLASHAKSRDSSEDTGLKVILSVPHCKGIW
ncbi:MAG TPA: hypothetical protein VHP35_20400, partial [Terriglobia bacterium]|nr:hypothetical protein [Terriglobia bacterium]